MYTPLYEVQVTQELNKRLLQEAEYERWRYSLGPHRSSRERLGQRLIRLAREWLDSREDSIPCNEALPACGLIPV
jgi:hypothetical protein